MREALLFLFTQDIDKKILPRFFYVIEGEFHFVFFQNFPIRNFIFVWHITHPILI